MKKHLYKLLYIIVAALIFLMMYTDILYPVDTFLTDRLYARTDGPVKKIVIIGVDEETISKYGNFTLWSREKLAELLNKLYEDETNAPSVVGLDFILSDAYEKDADEALAKAAEGRAVVVGTNIVYRGAVETDESGKKYFNKRHISDVEMPYEALWKNTSQGFTNEYIASDGYVRYSRVKVVMPAALRQKAGASQESFAYSIYRIYQEKTGGEIIVPKTNEEGQLQFLYSGTAGEFSEVSLESVLTDRVPKSAFKDAIVLVGGYAPGLQDSYQAAADRGSVMYGVEIHANLIQAYLQNKTLVSVNPFFLAAIISIIIILLLFFLQKKDLFVTLPVSLAVVILYTIAGRILSGNGVYLNLACLYLAVILSDLYFILEKYLRELIANYRYQEEIKEQMWSFTEAMTAAIDERTPYNVSHTRNVAKYSGMLADFINTMHEKGQEQEFFDKHRKEQLVMGALLHDIGKIAVPLSVMNKKSRLDGRENEIEQRLKMFKMQAQIDFLEGNETKEKYEEIAAKTDEAVRVMQEINNAGILTDELAERMQKIIKYEYTDKSGNTTPFFTEEEKDCLKIVKGTLTQEEQKIMQSHVEITGRILDKVHFNRYFAESPVFAVQHHERLNGTGYPKKLTEDELSTEARIIAVADILDALLAADRPYKKPLPRQEAFKIMRSMAKEGHIDEKLVEYLFECTAEEDQK